MIFIRNINSLVVNPTTRVFGSGSFFSRKVFYSNATVDYKPTIYALSTKLARSAIGVIRVSGSQSQYIYNKLTKTSMPPKLKTASVRKLYSQEDVLLDEALTLYFKSPKTYTGEDILELHLHGGTAIIQSVLNAIKRLHNPRNGINIRYAENGEFSRRAFINGRFDLTEIEGIREMIDAETESQRVAALSSLTGDTKKIFSEWREQIVKNVALLTTVIDFGEDHDIEEVAQLFDTVEQNMNTLSSEINTFLLKVLSSEVLMKGIKLILLGPPNAGKSSLLNYLANKEAAIVSDIAGTTRDVIDVPLDINGYKVIVGDTAGIRTTTNADKIEIEGIKRAKLKSLGGDLVLVVLPLEDNSYIDYTDLISHIKLLNDEGKEIIVVLNKQDLISNSKHTKNEIVESYSEKLMLPVENFHLVSCITGYGISELMCVLTDTFKAISLTETTDPIVISARAQDILKNDVIYSIEQFNIWREQDDVVLASESLKQAAEGIGKITGEAIGVEEVLGVVFSSFCIGK
ncbi:unnamed protein product [Debaryomyces fabryi]|nr:unnamed protein product [Debaryomyces fabryi]